MRIILVSEIHSLEFITNKTIGFLIFSNADGFIVGKEGYLFEEDYILEYTGHYFIGKKTIDCKLHKLIEVKEQLKDQGIELMMVIEPGKASFYPEYIPDRYFAKGISLSNYQYIYQKCCQLGIPILDLNRYFLDLKATSPYPLFSKYGMHWSIYGVSVVVDTLNKFITHHASVSIPSFHVTDITITNELRSTDNDIGKTFNLIFDLPEIEVAYPEITFGADTLERELNMLVIGDSYYNNIKEDFSQKMYQRDDFGITIEKYIPIFIANIIMLTMKA